MAATSRFPSSRKAKWPSASSTKLSASALFATSNILLYDAQYVRAHSRRTPEKNFPTIRLLRRPRRPPFLQVPRRFKYFGGHIAGSTSFRNGSLRVASSASTSTPANLLRGKIG